MVLTELYIHFSQQRNNEYLFTKRRIFSLTLTNGNFEGSTIQVQKLNSSMYEIPHYFLSLSCEC